VDNFISLIKEDDQFEYAAIIVEDDLEGLVNRPPERTKLSGLSVVRTIVSWTNNQNEMVACKRS